MANIMIRDLSATETLDRQASLRVKGGQGGYLMPVDKYSSPMSKKYPTSLVQKWTSQFQSAQVNNTAVVFGPSNIHQNGFIAQVQHA